jgi:hypothetical protein
MSNQEPEKEDEMMFKVEGSKRKSVKSEPQVSTQKRSSPVRRPGQFQTSERMTRHWNMSHSR